jgi:hypothetical protein
MKVLLIFETVVTICSVPEHTDLLQELCENLRLSYHMLYLFQRVSRRKEGVVYFPFSQSKRQAYELTVLTSYVCASPISNCNPADQFS